MNNTDSKIENPISSVIFTAPNEVGARLYFQWVSVILSTGGGGWPQGGLLLGERGASGGDPPGWLLLRAIRIQLECILVFGK